MDEFKCEYCNKTFACKYNLRSHQRRAKFCIEIQRKFNNIIKTDLVVCEYCMSEHTSSKITKHLLTCKAKKQVDIQIMAKKHEEELSTQKHIYEEKIRELEIKIIRLESEMKVHRLEGRNDILEKEHNIVLEMAKQPKVVNKTTNNVLNMPPLDLTVESVRRVLEEKYDYTYGLRGQRGLAEFAYNNLLKDNDGKSTYACADFARKVFKFANSSGETCKDPKGKMLTELLVKGGVKQINKDACDQWCVGVDGGVDPSKQDFALDKIIEINKIDRDNSVFVNEVSVFTSGLCDVK